MNFADFKLSLQNNNPPENIAAYLQALWYDAKNDWNKAHLLADSVEDKNAYWVHAYLHRKEGDKSNANYWYHKAGKKMPDYSLQDEWNDIAETLIK
jgi:hypothetical protein